MCARLSCVLVCCNPAPPLCCTGNRDLRSVAIVCTTLCAGMAGSFCAMFDMWLRYGTPDASMSGNGLLAGLVAAGRPPRVVVRRLSYRGIRHDTRNSPIAELVRLLSKRGVDVAVHDPFVREHKGDVMKVLRKADCAVLMVAHTSYRELDLRTAAGVMRAPALVDARGFFGADALQEAGFKYRLIGVGSKAAAHTDAAEPK